MSETIETFTVPVNAAGLPHGRCPGPADGSENLTGLSVEEVARLYWRLKRLELSYTYTLLGTPVSRTLVAEAVPAQPRWRACVAPVAKAESPFGAEPVGVYLLAEVGLWPLWRSAPWDGTFAAAFEVVEGDASGTYVLGLAPVAGWTELGRRSFTVFGRELELVLSAADGAWTGSVDAVTAVEVYWEVDTGGGT